MRVSNIYKLSPELYGMVSSSVLEDAEATSDKVPPPDGPLQTQANVNPSIDPFTSAAARNDSNTTHGSSALW